MKMPEQKTSNPMSSIYLNKLVLNIGIGNSEDKYDSAKSLLNKLTGKTVMQTRARTREPAFGIKKDQIIGAVVTLRKSEANDMLKRALEANGSMIQPTSITNNSLSFGVKEYIYFSGVKYDPKIGMLGLNVNAYFSRKGMRVGLRKRKNSSASKKHKTIDYEEMLSYLQKNYGVKLSQT